MVVVHLAQLVPQKSAVLHVTHAPPLQALLAPQLLRSGCMPVLSQIWVAPSQRMTRPVRHGLSPAGVQLDPTGQLHTPLALHVPVGQTVPPGLFPAATHCSVVFPMQAIRP